MPNPSLEKLIEQTLLSTEARNNLRAVIRRVAEVAGTPADGDTLEWDDATGAWVPVVPSGGTSTIKRSIVLALDGGGQAISTGVKADVRVPYSGTITGWEIVADVSGSIVIDVWKDTYANLAPTVADTITGTEKPTLSSASKNQDLTLSTWTTSITAGDWLRFNVDSASTVTRIALSIMVDASS